MQNSRICATSLYNLSFKGNSPFENLVTYFILRFTIASSLKIKTTLRYVRISVGNPLFI